MKQPTVKKRFSVAKLQAIARGELSITALFNTQPVIIASHQANGDVHANGEIYTSEQWKEVVKQLEQDSLLLNETRTILSFHHMGYEKDDLVSSNKQAIQAHKKPVEQPKIIDRYEAPKPRPKPQPSQAELDEERWKQQVLESQIKQERLREIRDQFHWQDVPFHGWLNSFRGR
jgi:hypothetical protein